MNDKNKNLVVRVVTAVVALPLVLWLLYMGGWWTGALLGWAAGVCAAEYLLITLKELRKIGYLTIVAAASIPLVTVWRPYEATQLAWGITGVVLFAAWVYHLLRGPLPEAPVRAAHVLTALVYGAGGLTALAALRLLPDGGWWVTAALVVTWGNDTSAYFFGRFLGKHKLYAEVSPGKTWEGFFGGFVGSIGGLFVMRAFFFPGLHAYDCLVIGALGSVLGPAGDLCESMLKRAYGVKDSGKIIPGHGGMLDRIDALIFNAPMVLLYLLFLRPLVHGP